MNPITNALFWIVLVTRTNNLPTGSIVLPYQSFLTQSNAYWQQAGVHIEPGSNAVIKVQFVRSREVAQRITAVISTNTAFMGEETIRTNGAVKWEPNTLPPVPRDTLPGEIQMPLPGQFTKP